MRFFVEKLVDNQAKCHQSKPHVKVVNLFLVAGEEFCVLVWLLPTLWLLRLKSLSRMEMFPSLILYIIPLSSDQADSHAVPVWTW